ncbi:MAG: hypothetical protein JWN33_200 [Candidatus Saccharibacteria bacterium]|nr:hypothetical protein [Candidatus Saccharibacteria bacterium]
MSAIPTQAGFTAVELLITLFVAAIFLLAGYQLYSIIVQDSGTARGQSQAASIAYDYLKRYTPTASKPCTAQTPLTNSAIANTDNISNISVTVVLSCPSLAQTPNLSKLEVTVNYNSPIETVKYATFINN